METILIKEANKDIGFEMELQLGQKQFHVILTRRNESSLLEAMNQLKNKNASTEMVFMDVSNDEIVTKAAELF
jgi:short-subunit dehydrogenase